MVENAIDPEWSFRTRRATANPPARLHQWTQGWACAANHDSEFTPVRLAHNVTFCFATINSRRLNLKGDRNNLGME
eukprot:1371321-Amphidinium_carterae.2